MAKITAREIDSLGKPGRYAAGDGLYLEVREGGLKSWLFRYQFHGKRTQLGLGKYSKANSLAAARAKALEMQALIAKGVDPKQLKDEQRERVQAAEATKKRVAISKKNTFSKVANDWWHAKRHEWTNEKHAAQNLSTLESYVFPFVGDRPISDLTVNDVLICLKPIWYTKTETASRVRQRMEQVFSYAKTLGLRSGENPAQLKNNLDNLLPPAKKLKRKKALQDENDGHFASMPYEAVPAFVAELSKSRALGAKMLQFTILTASRTSPVLHLEWKHIDIERAVWTIPAKLMKTKVSFKVPLSPKALAVLLSVRKISDYVFPSPRDLKAPMSNMAMLGVLKRLDRSDVTVHGFRASFRTWGQEQTDYGVVLEYALAHQVGSEVERAYQRSDLLDRRRQLMNDWGDFLDSSSS